MAKYSGTFSVMNNTGGTITNLVAQHSCGSYPKVTVKAGDLGDGSSTPKSEPFDSRTLYHDYWTVTFTSDEGEVLTAYGHCSFSKDDQGTNVVLTLGGQLTVAPSETHSCSFSYHQS